jgi:hypothetical protein
MKPKGRVLVLLCAVTALLVLPGGAQGSFVSRGQQSAEAKLAGTHGYHLTISATSSGLIVSADKGPDSVLYFVGRSKFKRDQIRAWLPGTGRISLRFHEHGRKHQAPPGNCRGPDSVVRHGVFTGWVQIRGDRGYTYARSRHLRGTIVRSFRSTCRFRPRARASSGAVEQLEATVPRGHGLLYFSAIGFPGAAQERALFVHAASIRSRGSMLVSNSATGLFEKPGLLTVATPPREATIDPPSPFTGTATFQQESRKDFSWTGDLAVELPGVGEVSLAGPKFKSSLCLGRHCRGDLERGRGPFVVIASTAAAPTPSPWRWPGSPR